MRKLLLLISLLALTAHAHAVKILIAENQQRLQVISQGPMIIMDGKKKYKVPAGGTFNILAFADGNVKAGSIKTKNTLVIYPYESEGFTIKNSKYNGNLYVIPAKGKFNVVEEVELEDYLYGVLPYEMSYSWPIEALKSQAVAARTYTVKTLQNPVAKNYDLYSDVRSQMYKGAGTVYPSVKKAVDETNGEVLKYKDNLFFTYYHANSGGHTDPLPWGGADQKIKPLAGAASPTCKTSKNYSWTADIPRTSIRTFINKRNLGGTLTAITVSKKSSSGRATQLTIKTDKGSIRTTCQDFRMAVGSTKLKSCLINSIKIQKSTVRFTGNGYGHGTGMCQDGAKGMAEKGDDYKKILLHYYPGSKIEKI
ncbi:stage II sporulation protein D [Parelusimicrobium proximum]|uniref:SpoIID/LytB domain-containing protein n=1 Tax=Parelusimicrobium proximum TaxID=3228953 RepID=UPI003D17AD33